MVKNNPKIGVALSGGSGRSIAHIGVLEVLKEEGIQVDFITACSSGTLVAASYGCKTMEKMKNDLLSLSNNFIYNIFKIGKSGKGMLNLDAFAEWLKQYFNKNFEDINAPQLGFVTVDILTGEPEVLKLGSLIKAVQASCAVPGLIEPVKWGNKILVDGGLFSVVPIQEAYEMGADIVIGVDIAATRRIIREPYLRVWQGYNIIRQSLIGRVVRAVYDAFSSIYDRTIKVIFYHQSDFFEDDLVKEDPNLFSILGRSMAFVDKQFKNRPINSQICDVLISPNVKSFKKVDMKNSELIYREGRRVAKEAIPEIRKIIDQYNWKKNNLSNHGQNS